MMTLLTSTVAPSLMAMNQALLAVGGILALTVILIYIVWVTIWFKVKSYKKIEGNYSVEDS